MTHDNPELGFQEVIAHHTLTSFMRSKTGWRVFPSAYGMATAWVAEFDTRRKALVLLFNVEMGGGGKIKLLEAGAYKDHNPPTQSHADHVPDRVLGDVYRRYFNMLSPPNLIPKSDDMDEI
ncbi:hypothetical protein DL769_003880 [Monosporascus sp. CRB-8-3]|nr:hypothetical protein DL769_003880 [Monosporascus sp. CRB-8-3]